MWRNEGVGWKVKREVEGERRGRGDEWTRRRRG